MSSTLGQVPINANTFDTKIKRPQQLGHRIDGELAFVLHTYPYRETSLLIEMFTRHYGRVAMIAKGAKRAYSALRASLVQFQKLDIAFSGKSEIRTLIRAEWSGSMTRLTKEALWVGFYTNELLMRLLGKEDPHEVLFDAYAHLMALSSQSEQAMQSALRRFELTLLAEIGYGVFHPEADIAYAPWYALDAEHGIIPLQNERDVSSTPTLSRACLEAIAARSFEEPAVMKKTKQLIRHLLQHRLGERPLHSREIFAQVKTHLYA